MSILAVIPARFASTRFPGKPLADINGVSMIERVFRQVSGARSLTEIVVATDDQRIYDHVTGFGARAMMTSPDHPSGTDRCYEALQKAGKNFDYVINVQGDEPFIDPKQIDELAAACGSGAEIITQVKVCNDPEQLFSVATAKVVLNKRSEALYFSRHPVPFVRSAEQNYWTEKHRYFKHIGIYAYRADILAQLTSLEVSSLEKAESLEQLRWLENGFRISCIETSFESHGVDTPADIEKVISLFKEK